MTLRIDLPRFSGQLDDAVVVKWHIREGDEIRFGDPVVDLESDSVKHLKRMQSASRIETEAREEDEHGLLERRARVAVRILASESGYLRRKLAEEGDRIDVGGLLGFATSRPDDAIEESDGSPAFRVVANLLGEGRRL